MSTQPIALWLADKLEDMPANGHWLTANKAAAELRRLHSVNAELLNALKEISTAENRKRMAEIASAAIAKPTGAT